MILQSRSISAVFLSLSLFVFSSRAEAQFRGDWAFSIGFGLPKGGIMSVKYFPVDRVGIEIHGGAIPHILNYGLGLHLHLSTDRPNTMLSLDLSKISGFSSYGPKDSLAIDTTIVTGATTSILSVGLGREFDSARDAGYFLLGPTYVLSRKEYLYNRAYGDSLRDALSFRWIAFVEGGKVVYAKNQHHRR